MKWQESRDLSYWRRS